MDVGQYHEIHCLRVVVPKRGEFNPAGKSNAGLSLTVKQQSQMLQNRYQVRDKNKLLCSEWAEEFQTCFYLENLACVYVWV